MPGRKPRMYFGTPEDKQTKQSSVPTQQLAAKRTPRMYIGQPEPIPASVQSIPYGSVILGLDTDTGQPVSVSQLDLCSGAYIVGIQGMGKSQLLEQVVYQQMQLNEAIIVIDPHGDLVKSIVAHMPEQRLSNTYLLDLTDRDYPFGLNAFVCSDPKDEVKRDETRNQIMHAFEKLWPETREGQYFEKILAHVVITLIENPELTLAAVRNLLLDENYRSRYTKHLKNLETRSFWYEEYNHKSESKRNTEISPFLNRLSRLLREQVISNILRETKKTINIRELIEERAILLVKLPVNEEAYKYSASVIGTFLMSMIYSATFSFADVPLEHRPGFTLIVDEFQNFATDEYAKLFEQGRKYKVKQFLAHQHRQQLERGSTARTNLAATLSANTIVAFRTITHDSRELASLYSGITARRRPTDISIHPLEKIDEYPHPLVKQFVLDVVDRLDDAGGQHLETRRSHYTDYLGRPREYSSMNWTTGRIERKLIYPEKSYTYKVNPEYDFGAGAIQADPKKAEQALTLLNRLIYESEERGEVAHALREQFIAAVTPFWKLEATKEEATEQVKAQHSDYYKLTEAERNPLIQMQQQELAAEARQRKTRFIRLLDAVLAILIHFPIAEDMNISNTDIAGMLEDLEKRHAFVKTGSTAYQMETRDTRLLQEPTTAAEANHRLRQVRQQTRARYCVARTELTEDEAEGEREPSFFEALQREPKLTPMEIQMEIQEEEPVAVISEPEIQRPEPPAHKAPEQVPPQPLPASADTMNMLFAQMKANEVDPETTILAALGQHYVLTIKQWMRLFAWKAYPKATPHFKKLREQGLIYRKDREGRGGTLVSGDWFFLLTKGANELVKRKQPSPLFKLEPNEAERAAGDTLVHTSLVNEVLIHLRLLEREHPNIVKIEGIDHERTMRRTYLPALGSDSKLYPDGFLRLLVPTPNGLKRRYLFLEVQHTTQKDKHNWQTKVRKYLDLFRETDTLAQYFHTRTPHVLVLTMHEAYVVQHKQWTEEVLVEAGERGRAYGNRFLIGSYDTGIADMRVEPLEFFCTPRFSQPFTDTPYPVFALSERTP